VNDTREELEVDHDDDDRQRDCERDERTVIRDRDHLVCCYVL